jgi:hypothetical protein
VKVRKVHPAAGILLPAEALHPGAAAVLLLVVKALVPDRLPVAGALQEIQIRVKIHHGDDRAEMLRGVSCKAFFAVENIRR